MRPVDHRLGVALLTLGRLRLRRDPVAAAQNFAEAYDLFLDRFGADDVRTAQAGVHLAALAARHRRSTSSRSRLADRHLPAARAGQNAILLAGLLSIKAEALAALGRGARRRRPPASTACAGRAMASATPTGRWRASRRSSRRCATSRTREDAMLLPLAFAPRRADRLAPRGRPRRRPARPAAVRRRPRHPASTLVALVGLILAGRLGLL